MYKMMRRLLFVVVLLALFGFGADFWYRIQLREAVLSYISMPRFSHDEMLEQITGIKGSRLEMFFVDTRETYWSVDKASFSKTALGRLTRNPQAVEFGKPNENGVLRLGDYQLNRPGVVFFRFPGDDFIVDPKAQVSIKFPEVTYTLSMMELNDFVSDSSIYDGDFMLNTGKTTWEGKPVYTYDHGRYIAKRGEPSINRLVQTLTAQLVKKEEKAQRLLDFVTANIQYDQDEAQDTREGTQTLRRPNEVLMARRSVCSGLTILYASLLEVADIDYRLAYFPSHISVVVEGEYGSQASYQIELNRKVYTLAEPTCRRFRIGRSKVGSDGVEFDLKQLTMVQKPSDRENGVIYYRQKQSP